MTDRSDRVQPKRPAEPDAQAVRNPAIEAQLTLRKQLQSRSLAAQRQLEAAQRELDALAGAERYAHELYQEYTDLYQQAQNAQAHAGAAKSGETRASELRFRLFFAGCLAVAFLVLAAIQSTASSMLVVVLLFVVPALLYIFAKAKALMVVLRSLPSSQVGDPVALRKEADRVWKRYQSAAAIVARKPSEEMLLTHYQQAVQNAGYWKREADMAEAKLQSLYSELRARQQQNRPS